jgi:hypothetical protein
MKFPVNFPVSREFGSGDRFDCDCVRRQVLSYRPCSDLAFCGSAGCSGISGPFYFCVHAAYGTETIWSAHAGRTPAIVSARRLSGTGVSAANAEFLLR